MFAVYMYTVFGLLVNNLNLINAQFLIKQFFIINTNLINGVILIHPILTYLTYFLSIFLIILFKKNYIVKNKFFFNISYNLTIYLLFSFYALLLGGY